MNDIDFKEKERLQKVRNELIEELERNKFDLNKQINDAALGIGPPFSLQTFWGTHRCDSEVLRELFNVERLLSGFDVEN